MRLKYYLLSIAVLVLLHVTVKAEQDNNSRPLSDTAPGTREANSSSSPMSSVLADGEWYRFAVAKTGVYKISGDLLRQAGVNTSAIDPTKISIHGYGGGMLPQLNSAPRPEDLPELPIYVHGGVDGKFDGNDFVVFYAEGPHRHFFNESENTFEVERNHYTDSSYFFVSFHKSNGKRIEPIADLGSAFPKISTYDDVFYHERDRYNILSSGRAWYGERFVPGTTETISFNVPDFVTGSRIKLQMGLMSSNAFPSTFSLSVNNRSVAEIPMESIPKVNHTTGENVYAIKGKKTQQWFSWDEGMLTGDQLGIELSFDGRSGEGYAYLDFIMAQVKRALVFRGEPLLFTSVASLNQANSTFDLTHAISGELHVWDVTHALNPRIQSSSRTGGKVTFGSSTNILRRYAAFSYENLPEPIFDKKVSNQNIRANLNAEMLIVSYPDFLPEAERLAHFRKQNDQLQVTIVTPEQIYNEFSSGRQDVTAIRDYVKFLYEKGQIKYLLLFGKCSYAYKDLVIGNTNYVPTYQSFNSLHPVETYSSDDFYGFLEEDEGMWAEGNSPEAHDLEIGIGRLPVKTIEEAKIVVDKIINYSTHEETYGSWRNELIFVADDEDGNAHHEDADSLATMLDTAFTNYHVNKLYLGAYKQEGNSSKAAQTALNDAIKKGALVVNYSGHGNTRVWAKERMLTLPMIEQWENYNKLSLFVTATCEFGKYDDPIQVSGGELLLLSPKGGAIGLVTTSRPVYNTTNFLLNRALYNVIFTQGESGYPRLGDVMKATKNNSISGWKNRNFTLLGDPSMKLAYPAHQIEISDIYTNANDQDTIKALSKATIKGYVSDNGSKISSFNGQANVVIYDKPATVTTLSSNEPVFTYARQNKILFKGKVTVKDGEFAIEFIVPKNINYEFGEGKISLYAFDRESLRDAHIGYTDVVVGGSAPQESLDSQAPEIALFMDDESFTSGDITGSNTLLLAKLKDESGININNNGLGQDILATLNKEAPFILNEFYEADLDSYKSGWVSYPINELQEGNYTLNLKVWDINSNSSEKFINFVVASDAKIALNNVLNYPNPFNYETTFSFNHNRAGEDLEIAVMIYALDGQMINMLTAKVNNSTSTLNELVWDGSDVSGERLNSGVYVYKIVVQSMEDSVKTQQFKRLVIIN